jgi:hypothetical protein
MARLPSEWCRVWNGSCVTSNAGPDGDAYTPKLKKRTALLRKLKDVFRRYQSQPLGRVIKLINPMLRGWVAYFAVGNSSECFGFVKDWVEKKIRRHMARTRNRKGFGWKRWNTSNSKSIPLCDFRARFAFRVREGALI